MTTYTIPQAKDILHLSIQSIRKYIRDGKIRASKVGTHYIITDYNLEEFLKDAEHEKITYEELPFSKKKGEAKKRVAHKELCFD